MPVDITSNEVKTISEELGAAPFLTSVVLTQNPQRIVSADKQQKGGKFVMVHLESFLSPRLVTVLIFTFTSLLLS